MKELSIKQKAKAYDKALDKAKKELDTCGSQDCDAARQIFRFFPELTESEDERIRKELIFYFQEEIPQCSIQEHADKMKEFIAWLEKQGEIIKEWSEMKINNIQTELQEMVDLKQKTEQGEQKPTDKVEPKFHEGEWVVQGHNILKIRCVDDEYYCYETVGGYVDDMLVSEIDSLYHLWTIQDAKDGDVLTSNRSIFIFSQEYIAGKPEAHCGIMNGFFVAKPEGCWTNEKCYPATKDERDILERAIADAGYTFDFEKKELKKIEQKPAWSEEDEMFVHGLIRGLAAKRDIHGHTTFSSDCIDITKTIDWLESLKDRVQPRQE